MVVYRALPRAHVHAKLTATQITRVRLEAFPTCCRPMHLCLSPTLLPWHPTVRACSQPILGC